MSTESTTLTLLRQHGTRSKTGGRTKVGQWTEGALSIVEGDDQCEDADTYFGLTDAYGDGCEWYSDYPSGCGQYDDNDFSSNLMCCACSGAQ